MQENNKIDGLLCETATGAASLQEIPVEEEIIEVDRIVFRMIGKLCWVAASTALQSCVILLSVLGRGRFFEHILEIERNKLIAKSKVKL